MMNRPIITMEMSQLERLFDALTCAAAKRPPITDVVKVENVLLKFGCRVVDAHMKRDVIKFDTLESCNAARFALSQRGTDVFPGECSSAQELIVFVSEDVLVWMALGIKVGDLADGEECYCINLMYGDDIAVFGREAA